MMKLYCHLNAENRGRRPRFS